MNKHAHKQSSRPGPLPDTAHEVLTFNLLSPLITSSRPGRTSTRFIRDTHMLAFLVARLLACLGFARLGSVSHLRYSSHSPRCCTSPDLVMLSDFLPLLFSFVFILRLPLIVRGLKPRLCIMMRMMRRRRKSGMSGSDPKQKIKHIGKRTYGIGWLVGLFIG